MQTTIKITIFITFLLTQAFNINSYSTKEDAFHINKILLNKKQFNDYIIVNKDEIKTYHKNAFKKEVISKPTHYYSIQAKALRLMLIADYNYIFKISKYVYHNYQPLIDKKSIVNFSQKKSKSVFLSKSKRKKYFNHHNLNISILKNKNRIFTQKAFINESTDLRLYPTDVTFSRTKEAIDFDTLQISHLLLWEFVEVLHTNYAKDWVYIRSSASRGWIKKKQLTFLSDKEVKKIKKRDFLVVTDRSITINRNKDTAKKINSPLITGPTTNQKNYLNISLKKNQNFPKNDYHSKRKNYNYFKINSLLFKNENKETKVAHMGVRLPLIGKQTNKDYYKVQSPFNKNKIVYISNKEAVNYGYLKLSSKNIAKQSFKMLGISYSWGEKLGYSDCSGTIARIYLCFGILLPKSTIKQSKALYQTKQSLQKQLPFLSLAKINGHIMMYYGKYNNQHYFIHNIWKYHWINNTIIPIRRFVITPANLNQLSSKKTIRNKISRYISIKSII